MGPQGWPWSPTAGHGAPWPGAVRDWSRGRSIRALVFCLLVQTMAALHFQKIFAQKPMVITDSILYPANVGQLPKKSWGPCSSRMTIDFRPPSLGRGGGGGRRTLAKATENCMLSRAETMHSQSKDGLARQRKEFSKTSILINDLAVLPAC